MARRVSATEVKDRFEAIVDSVVGGEDVIVQNHGTPSVVIVSFAEYESLQQLKDRERRHRLLDEVRQIRAESLRRNADMAPDEAGTVVEQFSASWGELLVREGRVRLAEPKP